MTQSTTFTKSVSLCPKNYEFSVPHTPQENKALVDAMNRIGIRSAWINVVQIKPYCWVHRIEAECPYGAPNRIGNLKYVGTTPTQGLLILAIAVAFMVYKFRTHKKWRRLGKRRSQSLDNIRRVDYSTFPA